MSKNSLEETSINNMDLLGLVDFVFSNPKSRLDVVAFYQNNSRKIYQVILYDVEMRDFRCIPITRKCIDNCVDFVTLHAII